MVDPRGLSRAHTSLVPRPHPYAISLRARARARKKRVGSGYETSCVATHAHDDSVSRLLGLLNGLPWSGMSVFRGSIAEYPGVVVDNFTNCERGRVFFLSHCHKGTLQLCEKSHATVAHACLSCRSHDWTGVTSRFQHLAEKVYALQIL